jgi:hypothetical protein
MPGSPIQLWQFCDDTQSCPHRTDRVIVVGLGIAEVHQQLFQGIAESFRDVEEDLGANARIGSLNAE